MAREYKDSGIEWIGRIPKEWKTSLLSTFFCEQKFKNEGLKEKNLLSLSYGKIIRKNISDNGGLLPESFDGYNIIDENDIVFRLTDLQNDKRSLRTGLCKERGIITSAYTTIRRRILNTDARYFHYLFHSYDECKIFYGIGNGVRQSMNYQDLRKLQILVPPLSEQRQIAYYLDKKCGEIDALITLQEQMIAQLTDYKQSVITEAVTKGLDPDATLVPSGIDWIGDVPEGWETARFYYNSWIRARLGWKGLKAEEYTETGYPFLSAFNIINNQLDWSDINYINQERYDESPEIKLKEGDVLLVKDGAGIGKCARLDHLPFGESTVNSSLAVITPFKTLDYRYLYYYLQSNPFKCIINLLIVGMGVPHLTQTNMKNIKMPLPPLSEQRAIASYLDTKCSEIDSLISLKRQKIEMLKDYKKSVIYECVTGKTDIL